MFIVNIKMELCELVYLVIHRLVISLIYKVVIQGGPKITERHTSGNNYKYWLVSVDGVFSPEKNYTKINHFG